MGGKRTKNNSYHFKIINNTNPDEPIIKYYKTAEEICNEFKCCKRTLYTFIKKPTIKSKYFQNLIIEKVREPIQILIYNPRIINSTNNIANELTNTETQNIQENINST